MISSPVIDKMFSFVVVTENSCIPIRLLVIVPLNLISLLLMKICGSNLKFFTVYVHNCSYLSSTLRTLTLSIDFPKIFQYVYMVWWGYRFINVILLDNVCVWTCVYEYWCKKHYRFLKFIRDIRSCPFTLFKTGYLYS